ncbi:MAG: SpoIID/LytB domain-containing protein [Flavobacteriales bacterium]
MRKLLALCFTLIASIAFGQKYASYASGPRVLTFADVEYGRLQLKVKSGTYTLTAYTPDSTFTMEYGEDDVHPLYTFRGDLRLNRAGCDSIVFTTNDTIEMRAWRGKNWTPTRPYLGKVTIRPNLIYLETIVKVPVEPYIAGVVEAEGGMSAEPEYHKAQAVLARTWLITNMGKHKEEGYHIKDDQSSQAFKGVPHGKHASIIAEAVTKTKDTIATYGGKPIIGFYHSNSGGQTVLPQDVWSQELPYCRSVFDPFSKKESKYRWTKDISLSDWKAYFKIAEDFDWSAFFAGLPEGRQTHYTIGDQTFKLETLRRHFKLRSTYFSASVVGDTVHFEGYGFGHGVGMAQQGAMRMAVGGFQWKEILDFYFQKLSFETVQNF